jgi:SAM-dependent methyltransferase
MDIAAAMTRLATRYVPGSTVRADSRNLPFTSNSFDAVWANASLLHLPKEAVGVCVLEILRVLSPGGIFFAAMQVGSDNAIESNRPGASFAAPRFFARYELDEWVACIEGPGFEVIESRATASWIHTFARKP